MKSFFLKTIYTYQKYISLDHGLLGKIFPNTRICRFTPSCSQYMYETVEKYGIIRGVFYGLKRIAKCNPVLTPVTGTYDPVI